MHEVTTPHEQVAVCCDRCSDCHHSARLIVLPGRHVIECGNAGCAKTVSHPDLHEAMRLWNLKQREKKKGIG